MKSSRPAATKRSPTEMMKPNTAIRSQSQGSRFMGRGQMVGPVIPLGPPQDWHPPGDPPADGVERMPTAMEATPLLTAVVLMGASMSPKHVVERTAR